MRAPCRPRLRSRPVTRSARTNDFERLLHSLELLGTPAFVRMAPQGEAQVRVAHLGRSSRPVHTENAAGRRSVHVSKRVTRPFPPYMVSRTKLLPPYMYCHMAAHRSLWSQHDQTRCPT